MAPVTSFLAEPSSEVVGDTALIRAEEFAAQLETDSQLIENRLIIYIGHC